VSFGVGNTATTTAIEIFNLMGQRVRGLQVMGGRRSQAIPWDGNDDAGQPVPSGTYWVRLGSADPLRVTILR
jgi:flagellar hook assembly protein FlgD